MSKKAPAEKASVGAPPAQEPAADSSAATPAAPEAAPAAGAAATPPAPVPPAPDYKALYEQANDRWLRARAELDNYRRRVQRELGETHYQAVVQVTREFLGLHDHLSLAQAHAATAVDAAAMRQGLELISAEFAHVLATLGVARLETAGKPFDPALQEAIAQEPSADVPAGFVLREWKAGFTLGDRLLRPAVVVVSSGPAPAGTPAGQDGAGPEPSAHKP